MDKNGVVIFGDWNKGQVKHPIYGISLLQNIEAFENPGIAKLKNRLIARSTIAPAALPIAEVYDVYGNTYTATSETGQGYVYKNGVAITGLLSNIWDLKIYKDYLFVSHGDSVSMFGPLNNSPQYFGGYTGFNSTYHGKLLVGQDDFLYRANGNFIAKIEVTASGSVGVQPTLVITFNALDLPDGQFATTLVEYGTNIMIGTQGGSSYYDKGNYANARVYPWNRQAGTLGNPGLADLPIVFTENGINALFQHANRLYVSAGTQGNMYVTDSTSYQKIATIPYSPSGILSTSTVSPNALSVSAAGTLLVGISTFADNYAKGGIYEIDISNPKYPVSYRTISTLSTGFSTVLKIGFINQQNYATLNIGWSDAATYGVDTSDTRTYSNFGGIVETEMIRVGGSNSKHSFQHLEFFLAEPLVAGQNIRISGRKNNKEAYAVLGAWGFAASGSGASAIKGVGNVISFEDIAGIVNAQYVQLKAELDQAVTTTYGSNINLIGMKLW